MQAGEAVEMLFSYQLCVVVVVVLGRWWSLVKRPLTVDSAVTLFRVPEIRECVCDFGNTDTQVTTQ